MKHRRHEGISLLVPFRPAQWDEDDYRTRDWQWLRQYWAHELPDAEIVLGTDDGYPFSKTAAINDAARRATGDIFVILDSDCYISGRVLKSCARRIRNAESRGRALWFVPYRRFHRLPPSVTDELLDSDPTNPLRFGDPYPYLPGDHPYGQRVDGHHYGALITMISRHAFWDVMGGTDLRFRGWGSEDVAWMFAADTLYGRHQTSDNDVFHMYHHGIGSTWKTRQWEGQESYLPQHELAMRYNRARFDLEAMRRLVDHGHHPHDRWDRFLRATHLRH